MRHALVSPVIVILSLMLGLCPAMAFEMEANRHFGPPEATNRLSILATTDIAFFTPLIDAFIAENPDLSLHYVQASSQELHGAIERDGAPFDLVISTAMDLQMKLANDGFAQAIPDDVLAQLPGWARWRDRLVAEVMGRLNARLFCCSSQMIEGLISGDLVMAYNVLGSYAAANLPEDAGVHVVPLEDFTVTLQRTALVPANAERPDLGDAFLRFLLSDRGQQIQAEAVGHSVMRPENFLSQPWLRPIRLDPGLLSTLDSMTRQRFLAEWAAAMEQP